MKKSFSVMVAIVLIASMSVLAFAACVTDDECRHSAMQCIDAVDATCIENGNIEYWYCPDCGKYFADEAAGTEIAKEKTVLAATGEHDWSEWVAGEGENCETGGTLRRSCSICGKTEEQTFSAGSHKLEYVEQVPSTCVEAGSMAHWHCEMCGKNFADQNAEELLEDVALPLGAHNIVDGKCTVCGLDKTFIEGTPGLQYTLNEDGTAYIVSGIGSATETDIVIASEYNGLPVTSIADEAFEEGFKITSVFIPGSVKSIGEYAFSNCLFLNSVTVEEGVTSIGDNTFYNCVSLTSITIPKSVTSIGRSAFCNELGVGAFAIYCEASSKPSGWDDNWNRDDLPVVWDCNNNDVADDGNVYYVSEDNIRYMLEDGEATIVNQSMSLRKVVLPENVSYKGKTYKVTSIIEYAFYYCLSLTSITIPDSITSIGDRAFDYCNVLTIYCEASSKPSGWDEDWNPWDCPIVWDCNNNDVADDGNIYYVSEDNIRYALKDGEAVVVGQSINLIGEVFLLASVTYNGNTYNVTNIGTNAFLACYALTSITIPDSITSIGDRAFDNCSSLTGIIIPDSVTSIGGRAFSGCSSLTGIIIPDSVTSIGGRAFATCSSLESIIVEEGNTVYHSDGNCLIETDSKTLIAGCKNSIIPSDGSVTSIGGSAFQGWSSLTSITIPDRVTSIGEDAFWGCSSLTGIIIPDSVTSIGDRAFFGCSSLTGIIIPDSVTSIGGSAFATCSSLESIIVEEGNTVYHSDGNCLIETDSKTFIAGCKNSIIPSDGSVTSIGDHAFYNCRSLDSIYIPDSVTSIGSSVFYNCSSLDSIVVEDGNTVYHSEGNCLIETDSKTLIVGCKNSVIPNDGSVTSIGEFAFLGCSGLTSVVIPDSVTSIGDYAFSECSGLTSVTIPDSVTSIGSIAFFNCIDLTTINFQGTMVQWQAIVKSSNWDASTGEYTVICTDGTISKANA